MLVGDTFAQLLKAISGEITARPSSHGFVVAKKLHCLAKPMHLKILAPIS